MRLDNKFIMSEPTRQFPEPAVTAAGFIEAARKQKNPVAISLGERVLFLGGYWRQVAPTPATPETQAFQSIALLATLPGRRSWLEDELPKEKLSQIYRDLMTIRSVAEAKQFTDVPRPVGVAVSEGGAGRLIVVGNGDLVSDPLVQRQTEALDFVGSSVDWLRDRPR